jgi:hypothetical protein
METSSRRKSLGSWMMGGAALLMLNATLGAVDHRTHLKARQMPFTAPATAVVLQVLLAMLLATVGVVAAHGHFMPIRTTAHLAKHTVDNLAPPAEFAHFNTREPR